MCNARRWGVVLVAALQVAAAPPALTADEEATLEKGEAVVRYLDSETGGGTLAVLDIGASPDAVYAAVVDVEARKEDIGSLRTAEIYTGSVAEGAMGVKWEVRSFGVGAVFHTLYTLDAEERVAAWTLDTSKDNDIVSTDGSYTVFPREGGSRLVYQADTDSGRRVPTWIKNWLTQGALIEQLEGMRTRAEAAEAAP